MAKNISAQRQSATTAAAQAAPKRVRQPAQPHQLGCWWDLRYPARTS